jgi:hypothetical protein
MTPPQAVQFQLIFNAGISYINTISLGASIFDERQQKKSFSN